jgi:hypothetical protein
VLPIVNRFLHDRPQKPGLRLGELELKNVHAREDSP